MPEVKIPYSYLKTQYDPCSGIIQDIERDLSKVIADGDFTLGEPVRRFETAICEKFGVNNCIGVNSGTDALFLTIKALDLSGTTILTQPNTFVATVGAIIAAGYMPQFVDVGPDYQLDLEQAEHRLPTAAIPVHLTGLARLAQGWPLVINDAAQAVGAEWEGRSVATFPVASCFSLHPLKNLHAAGDGGFITTNDDNLAADLRLLRNHGLLNRDTVVMPGYNSRLDSIQAVFAYHGLRHLDLTNDVRRLNAGVYDKYLSKIPGVTVPLRDSRAKQVFHTYMVQVTYREELIKYLAECGIEVKVHYPTPCHLQPGFKFLGHKRGDFPVCEMQAAHILSLPIHEYLTLVDIDYVINSIGDFYRAKYE